MSDVIDSLEHFLLELSSNAYDFFGWIGIVFLMSIESVSVILPSEVIMPLAGWHLVLDRGHGVPHVFLAGFLGAVGSLIGSLMQYYLARLGGRYLIDRYGRYFLITRGDLDRAERWFATRGELTILITRLIPGVRAVISIPAGVARMNPVRFSVFTFIGALPWTIGLAWAGFLLGENYEEIRQAMEPFELPVILAVMALIAWFLWRRIREIRREGRQV